MTVSATCRKSWICWTSFVLRVISDGVPKRFISRAEKDWTRAKTAPRRSAPDAHRDARGPVDRDHGDDADHERDRQHQQPGRPDVVDVPLDDAVVDDVGVQVRQVEVAGGLDDEQADDDGDLAPVGAQVAAQQADQHRPAPPRAVAAGARHGSFGPVPRGVERPLEAVSAQAAHRLRELPVVERGLALRRRRRRAEAVEQPVQVPAPGVRRRRLGRVDHGRERPEDERQVRQAEVRPQHPLGVGPREQLLEELAASAAGSRSSGPSAGG